MVIQTDMDSKRPNDQGRYLSKSAEQSSEPGCGLKTVTLLLLCMSQIPACGARGLTHCLQFPNLQNVSLADDACLSYLYCAHLYLYRRFVRSQKFRSWCLGTSRL